MTRNDADSIIAALKDKQLTAAVHAVQKKIDTGTWEATGEKLPDLSSVSTSALKDANEARRFLERQLIKLDKRIDALETASKDPKDNPIPDLWPDATSVKGGHIKVYDKDGKEVAELEITTDTLERWLIDAEVKKVGETVSHSDTKSDAKSAAPLAAPAPDAPASDKK